MPWPPIVNGEVLEKARRRRKRQLSDVFLFFSSWAVEVQCPLQLLSAVHGSLASWLFDWMCLISFGCSQLLYSSEPSTALANLVILEVAYICVTSILPQATQAALRNIFVSLLRDVRSSVRSILPHCEILCVSVPCICHRCHVMTVQYGTCRYMLPINADLQGGPGKVPLASFQLPFMIFHGSFGCFSPCLCTFGTLDSLRKT